MVRTSVPALVYVLQNICLFVALSNLEMPVYQVLYQLKLLTTAVFSWFMLKKQLTMTKKGALLLLFAGVALVSLAQSTPAAPAKTEPAAADAPPAFAAAAAAAAKAAQDSAGGLLGTTGSFAIGLVSVLIACVCSGFAGVFVEKMLKQSRVTLWVRNIQLGFFGSIGCLIVMLLQDWKGILTHGFFYGYNWVTWIVILNQAFGGLVVAVVIKYADNIVKGFAMAMSIVLGALLSVPIFGFEITVQFVLGGLLVVGAATIYSFAADAPAPAAAQRV